jgi:hypothetical protein
VPDPSPHPRLRLEPFLGGWLLVDADDLILTSTPMPAATARARALQLGLPWPPAGPRRGNADTRRRAAAAVTIVGCPGAWTFRAEDGRRISGVLGDADARMHARALGIPFPGDQDADR